MPIYEFICNYCGNKVWVFAAVARKKRGLNCGDY